jgi:hypothetical protein
MTPELEALERTLMDIFRDTSTAARLAEMAGMDASQIDRTGSSADVWHTIVGMAVQDGALGALVDRARVERPRNTELTDAWNAYTAAQPPARRLRRYPPQGQAGDDVNDSSADARIFQLQRDLAAVQMQVAVLIEQNKTIIAQQRNLFWLFAFLAMAIVGIGVMVALHSGGLS